MCPWFVHNETQFQAFNYLYCLLLMPFMWYIHNAEWWMNRHVWVWARMCASVCFHFWARSSDDKTKCSNMIPCDISILLNTTLSKLVSQLFDLLRTVVLLYIVGIILTNTVWYSHFGKREQYFSVLSCGCQKHNKFVEVISSNLDRCQTITCNIWLISPPQRKLRIQS